MDFLRTICCLGHMRFPGARWPVPPQSVGRGVRAVVLIWAVGTAPVGAAPVPLPVDCSVPTSACPLADTATQAGVWVGAAIADPHAAAEQTVVPRHFNAVTAENAMKWGSLAATVGHYDFAEADAIVDFAQRTGTRLRGHTLLWRQQQPADLETAVLTAPDPAARMRDLMADHIRTVVGRYRGKVTIWDVVNEPLEVSTGKLDNNLFRATLGDQYVAEAFRLTHAIDPGAQLFLNEILFAYAGSKARGLLALVQGLLAQGVPIHGVGIQAHFFPVFRLPTRQEFETYLRAIADLGVAVEITELDVAISHFAGAPDPLVAQAEFFHDVVAACMAVPACQGVTVWGISDGATWLDTTVPFDASAPNRPLLFDSNLTPKPAYDAVRRAVAARAPRFFDCNGDRVVTVDDIVRAVVIALGTGPVSRCPAFDVDRDATVTVAELLAAVAALLST